MRNAVSPTSERLKPKDPRGNEVLSVQYQGKSIRACVMLGVAERDMDDTPIPSGATLNLNLITDRSIVGKEIQEMIDEASDGDHLLIMCRTFNIRKDVLVALGFAEGAITA